MGRRELEATPAHLLVVIEVRSTTPISAVFDVVGKEAADPQRVVAQMCASEKAPLCIGAFDRVAEFGERVIALVVGFTNPIRAFGTLH